MPRHLTVPSIRLAVCLCAAGLTSVLTGCGSLLNEGTAAGAGVAGTAVAAKVTRNPTVAAGIGLGVLAAANAGVQRLERSWHADQQDQIAEVAGPLDVGQVAKWESRHAIQIEPDAQGRVTVSRVISANALVCKEIVFSVDEVRQQKLTSDFYVASICQDGKHWKWASAEPATERWGALQ
ncbi:hypothetical protein [Chitinasiproducens palmae]|uniref:Lipoprotein n=1 Tax=Chitinasiproducens palmae TaxID=1770053 RepID=A0A1H2PTC6_9BURK|nr:hypothetical protein [Chitinasiproducens palmae]SDV50362.1 hypothetical protein SAMN05216551_111129 [Chitinasiproducens palmae]